MRLCFHRYAVLIGLSALTAGCATPALEGSLIADPYESANREFDSFNAGMDQVVLRPLAYIYKEATPELTQHLVSNAVDHLRLPAFLVNNLLQGDFESAGVTTGRFLVNTLLGAGGLLDPASEMGLPFEPTDFGVTLAAAGVAEGPYVVAPLFGPHTTRHLIGRVVDFAFDPFTYIDAPLGVTIARYAAPPISARADNFDAVDSLLYDSLDRYAAMRSLYVQNRRAMVAGDEASAASAVPDIYGE